MKKIAIILVGCAILGVGIFFGLQYFNNTKKTVSISVTELSTENKAEAIEVADEKKETIDNVEKSQPLVANNSSEEIVEKKQDSPKPKEVVIIEDKKVATDAPKKAIDNAGAVSAQATPSQGRIVDKLVSWGFAKSSNRKIDTIIVHSSYNSLGGDVYDADKIIDIYKQYEVAAHYLMARDGTTYRLVDEKNIAWHAGVSKVPDGRTNVNDFSIGIEMINTKDGKYTDQQYDALNSLIKNLKSKYAIRYILGHNEIAPDRKTDPWGISWNKIIK